MDVGMAEAGQSCDEPVHREEEAPSSGRFGRDHSLWGSAPYRWDVDIVDQDATRAGWTTSRARGSHVGLVWHV
jgi:hypothetical protein